MEKRVLLAIVLCIIVLVVWEKFFVPSKPPPAPPTTSPAVEETPTPPGKPEASQPAKPEQPQVHPKVSAPSFPAPPAHTGKDVVVGTPLYRAVFTETGARLKSFVLKRYRETIDRNSPGKELVKANEVEHLPFAFSFVDNQIAALNLAPYAPDKPFVEVSSGEEKTLTFLYEAPGWIKITRQYLFYSDKYQIDLRVWVENLGSQPWKNAPSLSLFNLPFSSGGGSRYSFEGPALLVNNELQEVKFKKLKDGEKQFPGPIDWVAYTNQYFTMAVVPVNLAPNHARLKALDASTEMVKATLIGPQIALQPGAQQQFRYKLYLGPKEVKTLKTADPKLAKAVNFGWFDIIAQPLLVCLKFFNRFTHNYGIAIILLTVVIKILFWPLTHKSYVSMQAMKKLQPKMQKIREKYKDDKEKLNQEIMQLYRTHKVNPVGGCLPMILQIPVFFALYRVLYSSIAMRHAPFFLWINDLSAPDRLPVGFTIPYLGGFPVLTLLMGISMFIQQKMTPTTGDPRQEKMMLMMPIIFTVFFVNFPSGLVLYWLVNNVLSIGQQYFINKKTA
jgi:YidC/Oxa1 family membrane protein insertase